MKLTNITKIQGMISENKIRMAKKIIKENFQRESWERDN